VRQICDVQRNGDLLSYFDAKEVEGTPPPPSWNVAPTQDVPIVAERLDEGTIERHLLVSHWGLVPSWAKDIKIRNKLINARSETILEKPSFRKSAVKRGASYLRTVTLSGRSPRTARRSRTTCTPRTSL
jgi:putative SOS response-associated peptidase YedK